MAASSVLLVASAPAPVVDSPYLSILINRRDLGSSFELGVDKANQNLVVSGPPAPALYIIIILAFSAAAIRLLLSSPWPGPPKGGRM